MRVFLLKDGGGAGGCGDPVKVYRVVAANDDFLEQRLADAAESHRQLPMYRQRG